MDMDILNEIFNKTNNLTNKLNRATTLSRVVEILTEAVKVRLDIEDININDRTWKQCDMLIGTLEKKCYNKIKTFIYILENS